eukprot:TRINITY_DN52489_c0_g1_i1.p1 TRINITY_DN52489_c0_g1~~TRINITY_DN52489_c0_g1_i1.p1  ORF type:complete len:386 (+),score=71.69 TRINITY_DN52489_c0_g1_i1:47-1159(+)
MWAFVKLYFQLGFATHMALWLAAIIAYVLCPRDWPDVEVSNKRVSEGGPRAKKGQGHEPYDYDTAAWTPYALFKLAFALATGLLPVRLLGFVFFFAMNIFVVNLAACLEPSSLLYKAFNALFVLGCKMLCACCACYVSDVQGKQRLSWVRQPGPHPILVPNHITLVEAMHLHWLTGGMSGCMAKSQLSNPGFGSLCKFLNVVIVDTKDPDVKTKVNTGISRFADNEPSESGDYPCKRAFVIYPEGITNSQRGLFRFNTGAFAPGKPVLPVVQRFPYKHMNPGWVSRSTISAGNDIPLLLIRYMTQFNMPIQVKFMEVWEPNDAEKKDAMLFANNLQNYFGLQLDCCVTDTGNKILREPDGPFDLKKKKRG